MNKKQAFIEIILVSRIAVFPSQIWMITVFFADGFCTTSNHRKFNNFANLVYLNINNFANLVNLNINNFANFD